MTLPSGPGWMRRSWLRRESERLMRRVEKRDEMPPGSMVEGTPRADGKASDQVALEEVIDILMPFEPIERKRIIAATRAFFAENSGPLGTGGRAPHPRSSS